MLNFRPELVDMSKAKNFRSTAQDMSEYRHLRPTGGASYGWIASDLNPDGTVGDASVATAEKGVAIAAHQANGFIELLRDAERVDLASFASFGAD